VSAELPPILPTEHLERIEGFGQNASAVGYVYRPSTVEGVRQVFDTARATGRTVAFRGAGRSYGDASLNSENIVLDITRLNRILEWNPETGTIAVESGVTIQQLWQYVLPDGWWPPVVPGTMYPTLGGCAAMNIHGKNNFKVGPIGDHILEFEMMTPAGERLHCSREENADLFHAAIGGFGMLGCFTTLKLRMKKVYSGLLRVEAINVGSLAEMIAVFEERIPASDYLVGWIDAFARGAHLGRGQIHQANYLAPGEDPKPTQTLRLENQQLPDTILGLVPKSILWRFMRPFTNRFGMRIVNMAKYRASWLLDRGGHFFQSHAAFAFLLDYVPNWRKSYGPGGLIQYQSFIPEATALAAFTEQLQLCQRAGLPPFLAVFKRHRKDDFLMRHSVDGYSLALDIRLTRDNRERVWKLAGELDAVVLKAGGRFYFAKDSTLKPVSVEQYLGGDAVREFMRLKERSDPDGILETNLYRRLFPAVTSR
jgi:decaprenylphospho-beta-D-ribofuranose 2-oxidase